MLKWHSWLAVLELSVRLKITYIVPCMQQNGIMLFFCRLVNKSLEHILNLQMVFSKDYLLISIICTIKFILQISGEKIYSFLNKFLNFIHFCLYFNIIYIVQLCNYLSKQCNRLPASYVDTIGTVFHHFKCFDSYCGVS